MTPSRSGDLTKPADWNSAWQRSRERPVSQVAGQNALLDAFFGAALAHHPAPLDIMEVGCAPGRQLVRMARYAPQHHYSGLDFAADGLEITRTRLAGQTIEASLHLADARTFDPPQLYDLVVSYGLVEHFDDPRDITTHHVRLAKPSGIVGVMVPNYAHPFVRRALAVYSPNTLETHNLGVMSEDYLGNLLDAVGLVDVAVGGYGSSLLPTGRIARGPRGFVWRAMAKAWNMTFERVPRRLSPWFGFLWACGRRP
ncbi:MAG TPA: class I SAM-dependent methyltransferase [Kofleriaceae bacterium]|nr:class I SAM-dependent methyltransferase [Kofleriaceae bacterium]